MQTLGVTFYVYVIFLWIDPIKIISNVLPLWIRLLLELLNDNTTSAKID